MPFFAPPVVYDVPTSYPAGTEARQPFPVDRSTNRSFAHYNRTVGRARGRSVLKSGGVYRTVDTPDTNQVAAATEYYAGGHVYEVSTAVAAALTAAGYTVYTGSPGALVHGEALIPFGLPSLLGRLWDELGTWSSFGESAWGAGSDGLDQVWSALNGRLWEQANGMEWGAAI